MSPPGRPRSIEPQTCREALPTAQRHGVTARRRTGRHNHRNRQHRIFIGKTPITCGPVSGLGSRRAPLCRVTLAAPTAAPSVAEPAHRLTAPHHHREAARDDSPAPETTRHPKLKRCQHAAVRAAVVKSGCRSDSSRSFPPPARVQATSRKLGVACSPLPMQHRVISTAASGRIAQQRQLCWTPPGHDQLKNRVVERRITALPHRRLCAHSDWRARRLREAAAAHHRCEAPARLPVRFATPPRQS